MKWLALTVCCLLFLGIRAQDPNIVDKLAELGFTTLVNYIDIARLTEILQGDGPFTIFAPTDDAFDALPDGIRILLETDPDSMLNVLLGHTINANVTSDQLENELLVTSLNEAQIRINIYDNGAITATGSPISSVDTKASNGFIHGIDKAIFPFPNFNLYQAIQVDGDLRVLATLLDLTDLGILLEGEEPLTLFAPNDIAFAEMDDDIIAAILGDPTLLYDLLAYHMVRGTSYSSGLTSGFVETLGGAFLEVTVSDGRILVDDALVYDEDYPCTNGAIHGIDAVLIPASFKLKKAA